MAQFKDVTTETAHHTIHATAQGITILTKHFPRNVVNLFAEETHALLEVLLVWKNGLETLSPNDPEL